MWSVSSVTSLSMLINPIKPTQLALTPAASQCSKQLPWVIFLWGTHGFIRIRHVNENKKNTSATFRSPDGGISVVVLAQTHHSYASKYSLCAVHKPRADTQRSMVNLHSLPVPQSISTHHILMPTRVITKLRTSLCRLWFWHTNLNKYECKFKYYIHTNALSILTLNLFNLRCQYPLHCQFVR